MPHDVSKMFITNVNMLKRSDNISILYPYAGLIIHIYKHGQVIRKQIEIMI